MEVREIEDLKSEAASLNITHNANIGAAKLQEKIEDYYTTQETSGPAIAALVETKTKETTDKKENEVVLTGVVEDPKITRRRQREVDARKTRVVVIVDNDQRVNNNTTTCSVNCSNEFFDLGTVILPINEKIQACQGHINVLKDVVIPAHAVDSKTGLSKARTRKRYSVSFEDV